MLSMAQERKWEEDLGIGKADNIDLLQAGVAIRGGLVTPQKEDEISIRKLLKMPEMGNYILDDWNENPIRKPITLLQSENLTPEEGKEDEQN